MSRTATVRFRQMWFSPAHTRFRKGVHEVPEKLLGYLPSSAEILKGLDEKLEEAAQEKPKGRSKKADPEEISDEDVDI